MSSWRPDYAAHVLHTHAAKDRSECWRTLMGAAVMVVLYIMFTILYQQLVIGMITARPALGQELQDGTTPQAMYVILGSFGLIATAVFVGIRMVHARAATGVFGPVMLAVPQFFRVLALVVVVCAVVGLLPPYGMGAPLVPNLALGVWALLLPVSLLAVFIQTSAEEIFFRGYLQQQLAARFSSPVVWMVLPSILFAFGHYQPGEAGGNAVMIAVWAGIFGLLMADLTARSGSLGPAMAVHFANNAMAFLFTSLPDSLGGLALFHTPFGMEDEAAMRAWMPAEFAMMIVLWLAARLALRR